MNFSTWQKQFDLSNQRQDDLLKNQYAMQVEGMKNAGLNPAMINGVPSLAGVSSPSGGNSSGSSVTAQNDILNMELAEAQIANIKADTKEKEVRADNATEYWSLTLDDMRTRLLEAKETLPSKITIIANEADNSNWQNIKINMEIDKLIKDTESVEIDNNYKNLSNPEVIKKLKAETFKLVNEGKVEALKGVLAENGIIVGADWLTQLLAISYAGNLGKLMEGWQEQFKDIAKMLGDGFGDVLESVIEGSAKAVVSTPGALWHGILKGIGIEQ